MLIGYELTTRFGQPAAPAKPVDPATREVSVAKASLPSSELRTRVTSVESQLAAMRARLEGLETAPAPEPNAAAEEAPAAVDQAEEAARQKEEWRAHIAEVEAEYQLETRDPAWAREAQATITHALENLPALSKNIRSLDCRSETCRLEVINDHQPDFDKQLPLLQLGLTGLPAAKYDRVPEPDGKVRTIVYILRHADEPTAG
jgi:hypothetical protein